MIKTMIKKICINYISNIANNFQDSNIKGTDHSLVYEWIHTRSARYSFYI